MEGEGGSGPGRDQSGSRADDAAARQERSRVARQAGAADQADRRAAGQDARAAALASTAWSSKDEKRRRFTSWRAASTPPRATAWACGRSASCCRPDAPELPQTTKNPRDRTGQVDRRPGQSAHRPRHGEPHLGESFRPRHRRYAERFRPDGQPPVASRAAGLSGERVRRRRLQRQADSPADPEQQHVPAVFRGARRPGAARRRSRKRIRTTSCCGDSTGSAWRPRRSATRCSPYPAS